MKFDLLIAGGEVLDPGAGLRGVMDIAIDESATQPDKPWRYPQEWGTKSTTNTTTNNACHAFAGRIYCRRSC